MRNRIVTSARRFGKTTAVARARYEAILADPSIVIIELGPGGSVRVEKPITDADLVPELPTKDQHENI